MVFSPNLMMGSGDEADQAFNWLQGIVSTVSIAIVAAPNHGVDAS